MTEYIERDMLCRVLERYRKAPKNRYQRGVEDGMELALNAVKAIHTADVAPVVHGLWMPVYESEMTGWNPAVAGRDPIGGYICSACKEEAVYDCNDKFVLSNYCPHCGARMEGSNEHETN